MPSCPKCNTQQNSLKVLSLTNLNSITCPGCGVRLKADKARNIATGAIGGAVGALFGMQFMREGFSIPWLISVTVFVVVMSIVHLKLIKLHEVRR